MNEIQVYILITFIGYICIPKTRHKVCTIVESMVFILLILPVHWVLLKKLNSYLLFKIWINFTSLILALMGILFLFEPFKQFQVLRLTQAMTVLKIFYLGKRRSNP